MVVNRYSGWARSEPSSASLKASPGEELARRGQMAGEDFQHPPVESIRRPCGDHDGRPRTGDPEQLARQRAPDRGRTWHRTPTGPCRRSRRERAAPPRRPLEDDLQPLLPGPPARDVEQTWRDVDARHPRAPARGCQGGVAVAGADVQHRLACPNIRLACDDVGDVLDRGRDIGIVPRRPHGALASLQLVGALHEREPTHHSARPQRPRAAARLGQDANLTIAARTASARS